MKSMRFLVFVLVTMYLLASVAFTRGEKDKQTGSKGGTVEQEIAALSDQTVQAYLRADTSFIEKYFADDYTAIHSDGKLSTKAQEIENLKSGSLKYESIDARERYASMETNSWQS